MQFFKDIYFPIEIKPYITQSFKTDSGQLQTLDGRVFHTPESLSPKRYYHAENILLSKQDAKILHDFYGEVRGSVFTFRFTDDFLFKTSDTPTPTDIIIGQGDGIKTEFPLFILFGTEKYDKIVPVMSTLRIAISGSEVPSEDYMIQDYEMIVFDTPPAEETIITAGFHYDFIMRFSSEGLSLVPDIYKGGFKINFLLE